VTDTACFRMARTPAACAVRPDTKQTDLDAGEALAAAKRFPRALAAPDESHWPNGEFLDAALRAVRTAERERYIERLNARVEQHRTRLEEILHGCRPDIRPAEFSRYAPAVLARAVGVTDE
jgi:hypothetical protein